MEHHHLPGSSPHYWFPFFAMLSKNCFWLIFSSIAVRFSQPVGWKQAKYRRKLLFALPHSFANHDRIFPGAVPELSKLECNYQKWSAQFAPTWQLCDTRFGLVVIGLPLRAGIWQTQTKTSLLLHVFPSTINNKAMYTNIWQSIWCNKKAKFRSRPQITRDLFNLKLYSPSCPSSPCPSSRWEGSSDSCCPPRTWGAGEQRSPHRYVAPPQREGNPRSLQILSPGFQAWPEVFEGVHETSFLLLPELGHHLLRGVKVSTTRSIGDVAAVKASFPRRIHRFCKVRNGRGSSRLAQSAEVVLLLIVRAEISSTAWKH